MELGSENTEYLMSRLTKFVIYIISVSVFSQHLPNNLYTDEKENKLIPI